MLRKQWLWSASWSGGPAKRETLRMEDIAILIVYCAYQLIILKIIKRTKKKKKTDCTTIMMISAMARARVRERLFACLNWRSTTKSNHLLEDEWSMSLLKMWGTRCTVIWHCTKMNLSSTMCSWLGLQLLLQLLQRTQVLQYSYPH